MRDGALKIDYVQGRIVQASTNPGLDAVYRRMFSAAKKRFKRSPTNVESGIRVVIFGVFLLEALCNELYKTFLTSEIPKRELREAIWHATSRLSTSEKLQLAAAARKIEKAETTQQTTQLKALFDLRNRLVHFKDSDSVWQVDSSFLANPGNWSAAPDPELIAHLTAPGLVGHISEIEDLLKWFDRVFGIKRRTITMRLLRSRR